MKAYTGVGSRDTPIWAQEIMRKAACKLATHGWTLRSGAADGADAAFELGWLDWFVSETPWPKEDDLRAEIYVPWDGFNRHDRDGLFGATHVLTFMPNKREAEAIAMATHPAWDNCSSGAKKLHTRNVYQVLGQDLLTPSKFLICWAKVGKDGLPSGGTRTAWMLADGKGVECYNLAIPEDKERILSFIGE